MNLLIDTHIAIWALQDSRDLPQKARLLIENPRNKVVYSVITPWEIEIKHGKHPNRFLADGRRLARLCDEAGFECLPVLSRHIDELRTLIPSRETGHSDPFDRMLICQAKAEGMMLVTHDQRLAAYGEPCVLVV